MGRDLTEKLARAEELDVDLGLTGRNSVVTGGSRGSGRSIALGLAAEGANVAICSRNEERLREAGAEIVADRGVTRSMGW